MKCLSINEVAELLKMSPSWVRKQINQNDLPHYKLGARPIIDQEALQGWLVKRRQGDWGHSCQ
jgi:excisionase family DNA binding protein